MTAMGVSGILCYAAAEIDPCRLIQRTRHRDRQVAGASRHQACMRDQFKRL